MINSSESDYIDYLLQERKDILEGLKDLKENSLLNDENKKRLNILIARLEK